MAVEIARRCMMRRRRMRSRNRRRSSRVSICDSLLLLELTGVILAKPFTYPTFSSFSLLYIFIL